MLKTEADIEKALPMLAVPCILEQFVPFDFEASVVLVSDGSRVVTFPIGRNVHRDGILDLCFVPAGEMDDELRGRMAAAGEPGYADVRLPGNSGDRVFREGPRILLQRNGAAPPQFGTLYDRRLYDQPVPGELVRCLLGEPRRSRGWWRRP